MMTLLWLGAFTPATPPPPIVATDDEVRHRRRDIDGAQET